MVPDHLIEELLHVEDAAELQPPDCADTSESSFLNDPLNLDSSSPFCLLDELLSDERRHSGEFDDDLWWGVGCQDPLVQMSHDTPVPWDGVDVFRNAGVLQSSSDFASEDAFKEQLASTAAAGAAAAVSSSAAAAAASAAAASNAAVSAAAATAAAAAVAAAASSPCWPHLSPSELDATSGCQSLLQGTATPLDDELSLDDLITSPVPAVGFDFEFDNPGVESGFKDMPMACWPAAVPCESREAENRRENLASDEVARSTLPAELLQGSCPLRSCHGQISRGSDSWQAARLGGEELGRGGGLEEGAGGASAAFGRMGGEERGVGAVEGERGGPEEELRQRERERGEGSRGVDLMEGDEELGRRMKKTAKRSALAERLAEVVKNLDGRNSKQQPRNSDNNARREVAYLGTAIASVTNGAWGQNRKKEIAFRLRAGTKSMVSEGTGFLWNLPEASMQFPTMDIPRRVMEPSDSSSLTTKRIDRYRQKQLENQALALAEAVAEKDQLRIRYFSSLLQDQVSPTGDPLQRAFHFVVKGLVARAEGRGNDVFQEPLAFSMEDLFSAIDSICHIPFLSVGFVSMVPVLLEALSGQKKIHIISIGPFAGPQWAELFRCFAQREEGPPTSLRVTMIEYTGIRWKCFPNGTLGFIGQIMKQLASAVGIPFEFEGIRVEVEDFLPSMIRVRADEKIAVVTCWGLLLLPEESILRSNPRNTFLKWVKDQNPSVFLLSEVHATSTGPFFLNRVKEAIRNATGFFEGLDATLPRDSLARLVFEQTLSKDVLNVVACEGLDMVLRCEVLEMWQYRMRRVGFMPKQMSETTWERMREVTIAKDKRFGLVDIDGAARLSWLGNPVIAVSAWC